jgi:hypothetical protein
MSASDAREDPSRPQSPAHAAASGRPPASRALDEIAALLDAGDLRAARKGLTATRSRLGGLGQEDVERADALDHQLSVRERLAGPTAAFEAARARRDWVMARDSARRAAAAAGGEEAARWLAEVEACSKKIRAQWRIEEHLLDGAEQDVAMPDVVDSLWNGEATALRALADGGATLVLVSVHDHWVFLREIEVASRRARRIGWVRAPEALGSRPPVEVEGNAIRLVGRGGQVLHLSREPLDVTRWTSLRAFMLPDRGVESALCLPGGRFLWAQLKGITEDRGVVAIDLDEWRVCGRPDDAWRFSAVPGAKPARVLAQTREHSALYDERGTRIDWHPPSCGRLEALVAHPGGAGFLALCGVWGPDGEEEGAPFGLVEMLPGRPPSAPLVLPGTHCESRVALAVSLEQRRAFLLTQVEGSKVLSAFRTAPNGLERLWSAPMPPDASLIQDCQALHAVAAVATERGLDIAPLGETPPRLEGSAEGRGHSLFDSEPPFLLCSLADSGFERMELSNEIWRCEREKGDVAQLADKLRRERRRDPAALAVLAQQLASSRKLGLAESIADFGLGRYPGNAPLLLVRAELQACRGRWDETARILDGLDDSALSLQRACHRHHLRGLAHLRAGEAREAQQQFGAGARLDAKLCNVGLHLEVCRGLLAPLDEPPLDPDRERSDGPLAALVLACRRADAALERGDPAAARDLLDTSAAHHWVEPQSGARLAEAHLALEPTSPARLFNKAMAVARLHEIAAAKPFWLRNSIPGLGWSKERTIEVARRGMQWLEALSRERAQRRRRRGCRSSTRRQTRPRVRPRRHLRTAPRPAGRSPPRAILCRRSAMKRSASSLRGWTRPSGRRCSTFAASRAGTRARRSARTCRASVPCGGSSTIASAGSTTGAWTPRRRETRTAG